VGSATSKYIFNRNENYIATDKAGKVKGRITAKSLIGTVIVGIISSLCVIQMVNSLKLTDKVPEVYAVESLAKEFSSLDNLNPKLEVINKIIMITQIRKRVLSKKIMNQMFVLAMIMS